MPPHHTLVVDLSREKTPPAGGWVADGIGTQESFSLSGRVSARITLPGIRLFDDDAEEVVLTKDKGSVVEVFISSREMSLDAVCAAAKKYMKAWGFDERNIDAWAAERRAGKVGIDD